MFVEIRPPMWYPFHDKEDEKIRFRLASVGVWVIVGNKYFLVVQQADKTDMPWGIPSGRVAEGDVVFKEIARRELKEETGLELKEGELKYLIFAYSRTKRGNGHLLYFAQISMNRISINSFCQDSDGTIRFSPPPGVDSREINQLALIPLRRAFEGNLLNRNPYHPSETYRGYAALRRLGFIRGSFSFENDPGL